MRHDCGLESTQGFSPRSDPDILAILPCPLSLGARMSSAAITGSCLCGSIKFDIKPPFEAFRYCHCSRCRKASGSAHAANCLVPESQFRWLAGESSVRRRSEEHTSELQSQSNLVCR